MVNKNNNNRKNASKQNSKKKSKSGPTKKSSARSNRSSNMSGPTFGPISTVNSAPVAIGNSLRGVKAQVLHSENGARVIGRDFAFTVAANGTATGWTMAGGFPLTPACFPTSVLRSFVNMYNKFKIVKCMVHYITAAPTSQTGDILFYYSKDTNSPQINWTDAQFLPLALSDPYTVIGPQWTNHSILIEPKGPWLYSDYGMQQELSLQAAGDLYIFSKTGSSGSPGYVILDYDIAFMELSVSPRLGVIPTNTAQWNQIDITFNYVTNGASGTNVINGSTNGTTGIGATTIAAPTVSQSKIYKFIVDATNSTFTTPNAANNQFNINVGGTFIGGNAATANQATVSLLAITLVDGFTCYFVESGTSSCVFFSTYEAACSGDAAWTAAAGTATTYNTSLRGFCKYVGQQGAAGSQYSSQAN